MANKRSTTRTPFFWLLLAVLLVATIYLSVQEWLAGEADFVRYEAFGIDLPQGYGVHGIDVSRHQGRISWPAVQQMRVKDVRLGFAFIKATEGLGNVDRQFRSNWVKAKEAGMPRGAYHFFLATKSGKAQAQNFIHTVSLLPGDLPPVLDIEQLYGARPENMRREVLAFLQTVEQAYQVKPIIYSYADFYERYLGKDFASYPLWVAHYLQKQKPRISRDWLFWQYNEEGHVNGILTRVDFNVFNGDSAAFRNLLLQSAVAR